MHCAGMLSHAALIDMLHSIVDLLLDVHFFLYYLGFKNL